MATFVHDSAIVWKSKKTIEKEAKARQQEHWHRLLKNREKVCPYSPFFHKDLSLEQQEQDINAASIKFYQLKHAAELKDLKLRLKHREAGLLLKKRKSKPFGGKIYQDTRGPVLAYETIWSPQYPTSPVFTTPSPWPDRSQREHEGDGRIFTKLKDGSIVEKRYLNRFMACPRIFVNDTAPLMSPIKPALVFDEVSINRKPRHEEVMFRHFYMSDSEFTWDQGVEAIGYDLMSAIDPTGIYCNEDLALINAGNFVDVTHDARLTMSDSVTPDARFAMYDSVTHDARPTISGSVIDDDRPGKYVGVIGDGRPSRYIGVIGDGRPEKRIGTIGGDRLTSTVGLIGHGKSGNTDNTGLIGSNSDAGDSGKIFRPAKNIKALRVIIPNHVGATSNVIAASTGSSASATAAPKSTPAFPALPPAKPVLPDNVPKGPKGWVPFPGRQGPTGGHMRPKPQLAQPLRKPSPSEQLKAKHERQFFQGLGVSTIQPTSTPITPGAQTPIGLQARQRQHGLTGVGVQSFQNRQNAPKSELLQSIPVHIGPKKEMGAWDRKLYS